jgi:glycosyltransferase involved in cell wall biosynthesis
MGFSFLYPGCMRLEQQYSKRSLLQLQLKPVSILKQTPKVSIVVPSYHQGQFLRATLESIFLQQYENLEVIVVDGGSSDNSVEVIKEFADQIDWWVSEPDNGQTHAINKGFEQATGEILAWLNSDDLLLPGAIASAVNRLTASGKVDVVYGQRILIDENGHNIGQWLVSNSHDSVLPFADFIPQETLFWRREAWNCVGARLDESFEFAMDWDLLLRFKKAGLKFAMIDRFMGAFRFHPAQKTVTAIEHTGFADMERLRQRWANEHGRHHYSKRFMQVQLIHFLLKTRMKEFMWKLRGSGNN